MRLYWIMKAFPGITPAQIDEVPAMTWDWLLAIEGAVNKAKAEIARG